LKLIIFALALANFGVGTGGLIIAGVLPQIAASLAVTLPQAGALVGYASVAYALAAPILGAAFGTMDRRRLLLCGLAMMTLSSVIGALSDNYAVLLGSRILFALSSAVVTPTTLAIAAFITAPAERGRAISKIFGGFAISNVIGLPLGVLIASYVDWHVSLWYAAAVSALSMALVAKYLPANIVVPPNSFAVLGRFLCDWRRVAVVSVIVLQMGSVFVLYTYITSWFGSELNAVLANSGQTVTWLLLWFGLFGTIGVFSSGELMQRFKLYPLMLTLTLMLAIVQSAFSWMPVSLASVMLLLALWGIIGFSFQPAQQTRVIHVSGASANAGIALHASGVYVGQALGAFIGSAVLSNASLGMGALGWVAGAGSLATVLLIAATFRMQGNQVETKSAS
jgi:MFS transporter, DHA1 family, inner membrane transport protein